MHSIIYDHQAFSLQEYGGVSRYFCELAPRIHRTEDFQARVVAPIHFNTYLPACAVPQTATYFRKRITPKRVHVPGSQCSSLTTDDMGRLTCIDSPDLL